MSLKYRNKKTGHIAIVTGLHWESEIEKPNEALVPTTLLDNFAVVIEFRLPGIDGPATRLVCCKADFLQEYEPVEEKTKRETVIITEDDLLKPLKETERKAREIEEIDYKIMSLLAKKVDLTGGHDGCLTSKSKSM